jgi:hypothetical protein
MLVLAIVVDVCLFGFTRGLCVDGGESRALERSQRAIASSVGLRGAPLWSSSSSEDEDNNNNKSSKTKRNVVAPHYPSTPPDVTLVAGGRRVRAHSALLAARIDFFRALFRSGTSGDEVVLESVSSEVLRNIVTWAYTDAVRIRSDAIIDVLEASHRLHIVGLFNQCERILAQNLDVDNVRDVLAYAQMYDAKWLVIACTWFIALTSRLVPGAEPLAAFVEDAADGATKDQAALAAHRYAHTHTHMCVHHC